MSGSRGSTQVAYGTPGAASAVRRRPGLFLALASLPLFFVLTGNVLSVGIAAIVLAPMGVDVAVFGCAAVGIAVPTLLAVVSAMRPWWTLAVLSASFGSVVWLTSVGGGSAWLWLSAFWFMWLLGFTVLLLNRWARVSPLLSAGAAAVGLVSMFAGGAVLSPSVQLAVAAAVYAFLLVLGSVLLPAGVFAGAAARARLSREDVPVGAAGPSEQQDAWAGKRAAECAVAASLDSLPVSFRVMHSVDVSDGVAPVDHLVFGPTGVTVVAVTAVYPDGMSEQLRSVLGLVAQQRAKVMERLDLSEGKVFAAVVYVPTGDGAASVRQLFAVRPVGDGNGTTVPVVTLDNLLGELDTPFHVLRARDVDVVAAKARMRFRPARAVLPRGDRDSFAFQVGSVSPDGDVVWERDAVGSFSDGAAVALLTPTGLVPGFRVVAAPAMRDGVMSVLVCYQDDYFGTATDGQEPQIFAYPVAAVRPENA